ncbi:MAG TPA: ATP-binding protein [Thermodesulfobacteriota bacterium]|nr:ATP-binding protein [Thermodesulfobacteriota bacterium]
MPGQSHAYELLKRFLRISTASLPTAVRLEQTLQAISETFQSAQCLLLRPDQIDRNGLFSPVVLEKRALWIEDGVSFGKERILLDEERFLFPAFACLPLSDGDSFQGVLYLSFSEPRNFSSEEIDLLLLVAKGIGEILRNAAFHSEAEQTISKLSTLHNQLSTLYELNKTLLTTVRLERILQMTLTAITIGEGLRFNRAMLFIIDEETRALKGTMAVGPNDVEEAGRIWEALSQKKGAPSEVIAHLEPPPEDTSQLNILVKSIKIPLEQNQCILARTVLEQRPFNIRVSQSKEERFQNRCEGGCSLHPKIGCYEGQLLSRDPMSYAFATVPLWGKGRVIGVILVDNLFNQNPIEDEDIQFLSMFANKAGLAIENALLYRNLEEVHQELQKAQALIVHQEKMAALGELSNTIAHEIKNPLTTIGGFARRLNRTIPAESPEKRYTQTIIQEVDRVENVLNHFNHYTHEDSMTFDSQDLPQVLEESLSSIPDLSTGKIQLVKEYSEGVPKVSGDPQQLKQAFYNLIKNACESMDQEGTLLIRIYPFSKNGASYARVEIKDTGKGITPENLTNIFNPFYSTKESSLGLGLPIVHKIVTSHQGQIEVDNRLGEGVTFIITFPAFEGRKRRPNGI